MKKLAPNIIQPPHATGLKTPVAPRLNLKWFQTDVGVAIKESWGGGKEGKLLKNKRTVYTVSG